MTSDESEFAKFKQIAGDDKVSKFTEVSKGQLEDEVLKTAKEGKDLEVKDEVKVEKAEPVAKPPIPKKEEPKEEPKKEVKNKGCMVILKSLRSRDDVHLHTCAECMETKPVADFYRGKRDEVCIDCGGK